MGYSKSDIEKVRKIANIKDFIPGIETIGRRTYARCPQCGREHKEGMLVTHNAKLDIAKCFHCGHTVKGAIDAVMQYTQASFPEAVKKVADQYGIVLVSEEESENRNRKEIKQKTKGSFCSRQLEASGLTIDDVMARITNTDGSTSIVPTFRRGTMSLRTGAIDPNADEMLIYYYDLHGMQMKCQSPASKSTLVPYVRIRWSNPDLHTSPDGRPVKYQSLKGSEVRFYFSQKIRDAYQTGRQIDTLFIQEGEKKAEKACKHGIMSIGIQGIYNIGSKESGLIQDLQYIIKKCSVKNVVLLFDSDWDNLHASISSGDNIDQRPNQFAKAAIKFRKYIETLHNVEMSVDVWFGHINHNEAGEKGIDDILCGTLKGKESDLLEDIRHAMAAHDGKGTFLDIHKISVATDFQIMDFWKLRDRDAFFAYHAAEIEKLNYFKFGKINYRKNDAGEFIKATTQGADKEFWYSYTNDKDKKVIEFDHLNAFSFLEANGFYRIHSEELGDKEFDFVKIESGIVRSVGTHMIRDFAYRYALQNCKDREILNFMADKLGSLLGNDRLERLEMIEDNFEHYEPDVQNRFYANGQLRITAHGIEFGPMMGMAWKQRVIQRKFKRVPVISSIEKSPQGGFLIEYTPEGKECDFLRYLMNTSNFWKNKEVSTQEDIELSQHFVNKVTAIGYLSTDYKFVSEKKAVIAVDGKMSEVGTSNGRSGKSLIGDAISRVMDQEVIDGKKLKNDDEFMYSTVTLRTRNIFIDDVRVNFDFTRLFQAICGPLAVNPKQMVRFTIPFEKAPKFYITTNHAINDASNSSKARIAYISFSDWYNVSYSPVQEFGHEFFEGWDDEQWNLFDNLMAECIMYYLKSRNEEWVGPGAGIVPPPMEDIQARQLRQRMGETFYQWAETAFDKSGEFLNHRTNRKVMYDKFCSDYPGQRQFVSSANFREKLLAYCQFKGLHFNPHRRNDAGESFSQWLSRYGDRPFKGDRDNSGGTDYFSVCDTQYAKNSSI